jgi:hypothetical protein
MTASLALLSPQQIAQYRAAQVGVEVARLDVQQSDPVDPRHGGADVLRAPSQW